MISSRGPSAVGADANKVHGSIIALGYILSRASYYNRIKSVGEELVTDIVLQFLEILAGAKDASIKEAVFNAVGQISASGVLTPALLDQSSSKANGIIELLTAEAKKGNEKAISALGRLALVFDEKHQRRDRRVASSHTNKSL